MHTDLQNDINIKINAIRKPPDVPTANHIGQLNIDRSTLYPSTRTSAMIIIQTAIDAKTNSKKKRDELF